MPLGNGNMGQEAATEDRLTTAVPTLPMLPAPDLAAPMPADTVCSCEACSERRSVQIPSKSIISGLCFNVDISFMSSCPINREISAESESESQQLQNHWSEVRYLVRCIYRQTGTPLADDHDQPLERDKESMKELVDRYNCFFLFLSFSVFSCYLSTKVTVDV